MSFANIKFPDRMHLIWLRGEVWEVTEPYTVVWSEGVRNNVLTVPKGFRTDLSSIPELARGIIPQIGDHNGPSLIHDYLYETRKWDRKRADDFFLAAMKAVGVPWLRRNIMWAAVRAFGGRVYEED